MDTNTTSSCLHAGNNKQEAKNKLTKDIKMEIADNVRQSFYESNMYGQQQQNSQQQHHQQQSRNSM